EHNGDLYSCDHYVEDDYRLGNIAQGRTLLELAASPQQTAFGNAKLDTLPEYCRSCDVRFACNGGCPKDRFLTTPDGEPGLHYLCAGYQRFFRHVDEPMRVMAALLRRGSGATGVRDWYAARDAVRFAGTAG
ncbi:MAG: SPASM domain-containing protein, partial [Aeromicrobium sp.]